MKIRLALYLKKQEKIALYEKLLSDPNITEAQREEIAKLLVEEKAEDDSLKSPS
jgi:hypothetical protein